jgi:hypothetical protein
LRYFCAVADHGSFSEAGRQLHLSQSAISEQIADLEREIGGDEDPIVQDFLRLVRENKGRIQPTSGR